MMSSNEDAFLREARRELDELLAERNAVSFSEADAYRILVLLARLRDAPSRGERDVPSVDFPDLLGKCFLPTAEEVLEELSAALEGEDDPAGGVHDALIDVDDLAGVLGWTGNGEESIRLVDAARALVEKYAWRVAPLFGWAEMRRGTLSEASASWPLWRDVVDIANRARAGARQIREYLRPLTLPGLPRIAAATPMEDEIRISDDATLYPDPDTHELKIDIVLPARDTNTPMAVVLVALRRGTGEKLGSMPLAFERDGRDLYVSLGPAVGPTSARHRFAERLGIDITELVFEVRFDEES